MNLYFISQGVHNGYDTYSDAVVAAKSVEAAQLIHPDDRSRWNESEQEWQYDYECRGKMHTMTNHGEWVDDPSQVEVTLIGTSMDDETGVICASYHAG